MSRRIDICSLGTRRDLVDQVEAVMQVLELGHTVGCRRHCAGGRQEDELPRKCCNTARHTRAASKARGGAQAASKARGGTHALLERKLQMLGAAHASATTQKAEALAATWQQCSIA
eukprot:6481343-Amphidinium_carterae.1